MNDTKTLIGETPTGSLRWVRVASSDRPHKHEKVLQQKWEIISREGHGITYDYEWRDVPEGGEK